MFKSFSATALAAALSFLIISSASAQVSNPGKVYQAVDTMVVLSILGELGYGATISQAEGLTFITATKAGVRPLIMTAASCGVPEAPNCSIFMTMGFAPISILPGATIEARMTTLSAINAYEEFLMVKFAIIDPSMLSGMRTELYPYGATRGNIAMSIDTVASVSATAFAALTSMASPAASFSGTLETPLGGKGDGASFSSGSGALPFAAPDAAAASTPQSLAAQKVIDVIGTLVKSKTFRQDILYSR